MNPSEFIKEIKPAPYLEYKEYDFEKRLEDTFMRIARAICPKFEISIEDREIYEQTIKYFAADTNCKYDLNKGLYVYGKIGVGKTMYFKIFRALNRAVESPNNFRILTVTDLVDGVSKDGYQYFVHTGIVPQSSRKRPNWDWNGGPHFLLDDLGQSERTANNFGNKIDVVIAFLQRRYYAFCDNSALTHISTNIIPSEMVAEYGEAINSRCREMFNIILFPGEDKRK